MKNAKVVMLAALLTAAGMTILLSLAAGAGAGAALQEVHSPAALAAARKVSSWSSGWVDIAAGTVLTLTHDLGGSAGTYAVDLWFRDTAADGLGINQRAVGGLEAGGNYYGAYWQNLTNSTIQVVRLRDDVFADQVYVQVWTADTPAWDSSWVDIAAGTLMTLPHNVGGSAGDYIVGLWLRDTTPGGIGINSAGYGGLEMAGQIRGAGWQNLTANTISVRRYRDDIWADQIRVRIFIPEPPAWDSGWVDIAAGTVMTLPHNLGGNPVTYVVRDWHRDTAAGGIGINHQFAGGYEAGGNFLGANWQDLSSTNINVFRFANDWVADQMRVRIWAPAGPTTTPTVTAVPGTPTRTSTPSAPTRTPTRTTTPGAPTRTPTRTATPGTPIPTPAGEWQNWTNANWVHDLALSGGTLWAGTEGGAVRWNPATGSYTKYLAPDGLMDNDVQAVATSAGGVTWFGTSDNGLLAYNGAVWTAFTTDDGLVGNFVRGFAIDGNLRWVGTTYGLSVYDDGGTLTNKADDTCTSFGTADGLVGIEVRAVALDSHDRKWMATLSGVSVLDDAGTPHEKADDTWTSFRRADGLAYDWVYALVIDEQDRVWAATASGVSVLDYAGTPANKADDTWVTFGTADGLADDDAFDLAMDSQGQLWVATYGGGIFVLDPAGTPFDKADDTWTQFSTSDGLLDKNLYALVLDEPAQQVWAGSWGYGISRLDYAGTVETKDDDTWTNFLTADPLPNNLINALQPDGELVWVGTSGGGLVATNGQVWTTFTTTNGLANNTVNAFAAQDGIQWIGTKTGVNAFDDGGTPHDKVNDQWATFKTADGLWGNSVYDVDVDSAGRIWAACSPESGWIGGLSVLDDGGTPFSKGDDRWFSYVPTDTNGIFNGYGYEIAVDGAQRVWLGGQPIWDGSKYVGGGLILLDYAGTPFDKGDDTWTVFTKTHGLPDDFVYAVALDSAGRVWAGTFNGLGVLDYHGTPFDKGDDTWTKFTSSDGLAHSSVQAISFDETGRLWLATNDGFSVLDTHGTPHEKADDVWFTWRVADGLADNRLLGVAIDASGAVWVGTDTGLSRKSGGVVMPTPTATASRTPTPTVTPTVPAGQCPPNLISPAPGAVLDNGRQDFRDIIEWDFDWSDCTGATRYHLLVANAGGVEKIDEQDLTTSTYHYIGENMWIAEQFRHGYTWKVRAMVGGQWGSWSETRTFDLEPVDTDPPMVTPTPTRTGIPSTAKHVYLPVALRNHASPVPPTPTPTATMALMEHRYADDIAESYQSADVGRGFAAFFPSVAASRRLVRARFYLRNPAPIQVHIWNQNKADRFAPFTAYPAADGWLEADLLGLNLYTTDDDFYVGFTYVEGYRPDIGVDTSDPRGHSYEVDGAYYELRDGLEYMIGIVVGQ